MNSDQFNVIVQEIERVFQTIDQNPSWETAAWVATVMAAAAAVVTTMAAIYTLLFVRKQLLATHASTKAAFLATLDQRWEGSDMRAARAAWTQLKLEIKQHVDDTYSDLPARDARKRMAEYCNQKLWDMKKKSTEAYNTIMSIFGFYETLGYTIKKGFMNADDIADLYGDSILEFDRLCWLHIEKRVEESSSEAGVPSKLWEHARSLVQDTKKFYRISETN